MSQVELFSWNPRRWKIAGHRLPFGPYVNNFGDMLGPEVVRQVLRIRGLDFDRPASRPARLLSVGSVLHLAKDGDVVWGSGANGKILPNVTSIGSLDIRAVRGPLTQQLLAKHGVAAPSVFGDPGLLVGQLWSRESIENSRPNNDVLVVPNLNDFSSMEPAPNVIDPRTSLWDVIGRIAVSELVVGSSLHAIVVAEALQVPARLIRSAVEHPFKYEDYYLGSGRGGYRAATGVRQAIELGGEPPPRATPSALLEAFPCDLWGIDVRSVKSESDIEQDRA